MGFPAKFPGICSKCSGQIKRGEEISWSRSAGAKATIYHSVCPSKDAVPVTVPDIVNQNSNVTTSENGKKKERKGNTIVFPTISKIMSKHTEKMIEDAIKDYAKNKQSAKENADSDDSPYGVGDLEQPEPAPSEEKEEKKDNPKENPADSPTTDGTALDVLAEAVAKRIKTGTDEEKVKEIVKDAVKKASLPLSIEVKTSDDKPAIKLDGVHENFASLLYFISKRHHVYLYGPAGSGKSTGASQVAKALELQFGYISLNPQTPDSRLLGFIDAGGTYRETVFFKLYRDGGVFCIDEMDNASASLLTTLNSMLENGHGAFPCGIIPRHKDFVIVATGNTNGKGANPMFPERRPFDVAFSERFTFLQWGYDEKLERSVTLSINPNAESWLQWIWDLRKHCQREHPRVLVSPRASFKGAEYLKDSGMSGAEIAEALIFKGLDADTIKKILAAVPVKAIKADKP